MKVIIAEKPNLGRNIIRAIGASNFKSYDGYAESPEYIVTWAFGHLFGLYGIEDYTNHDPGEKVSWTLEGLPFMPETFKFCLRKKADGKAVDPGIRKQFEIIKKLCKRSDVEYIIHAGDADREGEIIIRMILEQADNKKPVKRLWLPEQTGESIRAGLRALRPDSAYDNLAREGYARTYTDWLYGVNLTRLATVKANTLLRVGRVIVPIVHAIYDRDKLIADFVPEPYLAICSKEATKGHTITLNSKKTFAVDQKAEAEALIKRYNATPAIVTDVKTEKKEVRPGKLFSLSKLQGFLGKKHKLSPKESLDIVQKLYEAGYVTYPRTNTEYLAIAEAGRINSILSLLRDNGFAVTPKDKKKSIYDDSKVESHSALTPTMKFPQKDALSPKEDLVYQTIFNRFVAVFCSEPCTVDRTTIVIDVGELERFKLTGDVILTKGWLAYEASAHNEKTLPPLSVGEKVRTHFQLVEKATTPPKHYTSETLNNFLKNPFRVEKLSGRREEDQSEDEMEAEQAQTAEEEAEYKALFEGVELGTEATRTSIIENAIQSKYISLKNDVYTIQPNGIFYIETLQRLGICLSKEKTAQLGRTLKQVYRGQIDIQQCVEHSFREIQALFAGTRDISFDADAAPVNQANIVGRCPLCGSEIKENSKAFSCSNEQCSLVFFKDNKLLTALGKRLSATSLKTLLSKGSVTLKNCKSAKTKKTFDCILTFTIEDGAVNYDIEFPDPEDNAVGICPKCGGLVLPNRFGNFSCANLQRGCKYTIFGSVCGKKLTKANARDLLAKGRTAEIKGFVSKTTGKKFNARLLLGENGKTTFMFSDSRRK